MTDAAFDWNKYKSAYMKFETVGDEIMGTITAVDPTSFRDPQTGEERLSPCLTLDTKDGVRKVTCSQTRLKARLADLQPGVGDQIGIRFTGTEKSGMGTAKLFHVVVQKAGTE